MDGFVGTRSKRINLHSPVPFKRRYVGEKGIGRFAVDKLGERLLIKTKKKGTKKRLLVEINWDDYERASKKKATTLFTEIRNTYSLRKSGGQKRPRNRTRDIKGARNVDEK